MCASAGSSLLIRRVYFVFINKTTENNFNMLTDIHSNSSPLDNNTVCYSGEPVALQSEGSSNPTYKEPSPFRQEGQDAALSTVLPFHRAN